MLRSGCPLAAACVLALAACSEPSQPAQTPPATPLVATFMIPDITTDTGAMVPSVYLEQGGGLISDAPVQAVAGELHLMTLPDLSPVTAQVIVHPETPIGVGPTPGRVTIDVVPSQPLVDAWYVLAISSLPQAVTPDPSGTTTEPRLGAYASRFNSGPAPVIQQVSLCEPSTSGGATKVVVDFSEGMVVDSTFSSLFTVTGGDSPVRCALATYPAPEAAPSPPATEVEFECGSGLWTGAPQLVTLAIQRGLASATGQPLGMLNAGATSANDVVVVPNPTLSHNVDFTNLSAGSGCKRWKAELAQPP